MKSKLSFTAARVLLLPCAGILLGILTRPEVPLGGPEVFCVGSTEYTEAWVVPPGGIPWQVCAGPFFDSIAPGLPNHTCHTGFPYEQRPGIQSMCRAARRWNDVAVPFAPPPGSGPIQPVYPQPVVSTFRIAPDPSGLVGWTQPNGADVNRAVRDGVNLVTAWQPQWWWSPMGGPTAVAFAPVYLSTAQSTPALIVEADIAINARTCRNNRPDWSFVEDHALDQRTYATHCSYPFVTPYMEPAEAYVDLEGVLVHEFGHFAGLGHSVLDSVHTGSTDHVPTMFLFGHGEPSPTKILSFTDPNNPCAAPLTVSASPSATNLGGVLARTGRTLELDDIAAIGEAYPTAAFNSLLGTVSGKCFLDNLTTPIGGAHVVALRRDDLARLRVGSYSHGDGSYTIRGLPPGEYYIYAEPVDQRPAPGSNAPGYYFDADSVPSIVYQGTFTLPSGLIGRGCLPNNVQPRFGIEYWDLGEAFLEFSPMTADIVVVTAGSTAGNHDFLLSTQQDVLTIGRPNAAYHSPRGHVALPSAGSYPAVELRLAPGLSYANLPVGLFISSGLREQPLAGQVLLPDLSVGFSVTLGMDANGLLTVPIPIAAHLGFTNFFIQAVNIDSAWNIRLSNTVNLWLPTR